MVGIGISATSAGSDAVSLAKSSRGGSKSSGDGPGGFLDALSNSGSGRDTNAASKNANDSNSKDASGAQGDGSKTQSGSAQSATSTGAAATGKDAKNTAAQSLDAAAQTLVNMPEGAPAVPTVPAIATPDTGAANTPVADLAQQLAAMTAGDTSGQPVTDTKGNLPAVKGGKTDAAKDDDTDDDSTANANTATGAISDALSLLGAGLPVTTIPAQTAASVLAAAGQLHSGSGKVQAGVDGNVAALPADVADDKADAVATGMAMLASGALGNSNADAGTATDDDAAAQDLGAARASTKALALDLAAGKNADEAAQQDIKAASGDGTGNVIVLDSRRFVGLADGSNSALVANSLTGNKEWAAAMQPNAALTGASVVTSPSKVVNTLKIQMNPENLGSVTATMRLSGEQLSVDLKVQSAEAYRQLSNDQSAMVDSLRQQGYSVDRITVTYTASDNSSNSQSGNQGQQQQQQSGASQGQGGEAQARKQNSGRQAGDQDGVWGTGNVGADDGAGGSAQRTGTGGVYL